MDVAILAAPGSDPGAARSRGVRVVTVGDPIALATAAREAPEPYLLVLAAGAAPRASSFAGLDGALAARVGVLGGATHVGAERRFGFMLAPGGCGPLPFALAPIAAPAAEAGVDALVGGCVDVVAPEMMLAARALLLDPLPADPLAAALELCERARDAGLAVVCRPAFACDARPARGDDRGSAAALRALALRRPGLAGTHRNPPAVRRRAVDREIRLGGGRRTRMRRPVPAMTVLVHGVHAAAAVAQARAAVPKARAIRAVGDPVAALRDELRIRGDRYVLIADAAALPDADGVDALVDALEDSSSVALAAPHADLLDGRCVLIAAGRLPAHVVPHGATPREAFARLVGDALALRRGVRAPGFAPRAVRPRPSPAATVIFASASVPQIAKLSFEAAFGATRSGDRFVAVRAARAETIGRILAAYPQVSVEVDDADPFLTSAIDRALGTAQTELVALVADDVLLAGGALERARAALERVPSLGAAVFAVGGASGGECAAGVSYDNLSQLQDDAERRARERARELEPIDDAGTPALVLRRTALEVVGGIAPALGPTRSGIADLVLRLRAAGYGVARVEDALAHRFDPAVSRNPAALVEGAGGRTERERARAIAAGFDPASRVPFVRERAARDVEVSTAIVLPVGDPVELASARAFVTAASRRFDAASPLRVHVLLDGAIAPTDAAVHLRDAVAAAAMPLEDALCVRVERCAGAGEWRAAQPGDVRLLVGAGHPRDALGDLPTVAEGDLEALLATAALS